MIEARACDGIEKSRSKILAMHQRLVLTIRMPELEGRVPGNLDLKSSVQMLDRRDWRLTHWSTSFTLRRGALLQRTISDDYAGHWTLPPFSLHRRW